MFPVHWCQSSMLQRQLRRRHPNRRQPLRYRLHCGWFISMVSVRVTSFFHVPSALLAPQRAAAANAKYLALVPPTVAPVASTPIAVQGGFVSAETGSLVANAPERSVTPAPGAGTASRVAV